MKNFRIAVCFLSFLVAAGHALAQREGEKPKEPVFLDEEGRLEVIDEACNDGNQALQIANVGSMVSGTGFSQIVTPSAPIDPLDCQVVRVRFHTAAPGTFHGQLTIDNNDPDGGEDPYGHQLQEHFILRIGESGPRRIPA